MAMRPKTHPLPPRMLMRTKTLKSGAVWVGYYYNGRDTDGRRREIPLGTDLAAAKLKWAELEQQPAAAGTMRQVFDRYERELIPTMARATQEGKRKHLAKLRPFFGDAPIDAITPHHIALYRDGRSAKVSANRELATLSHCFNLAREWGHTRVENPCRGVRKNKEKPRDFYADADVWAAVYAQAGETLRDAMDLAYLTAQRPGDVLRMTVGSIADGMLEVAQGKTGKRLRIRIEGELKAVIDRITSRPRKVRNLALVAAEDGGGMTVYKLWHLFNDARAAAVEAADSDALAEKIQAFQFRDIRAKAASDIEDIKAAKGLLAHSSEELTRRVYVRKPKVVSPVR